MGRRLPALLGALLLAGVALWTRVRNAFTYPPDWGYDAGFNWQYIVAVSRTWQLPPPDAGWSTSDPPLYFFAAAALFSLFPDHLVLVPLLNVLAGLGVVALAMGLVRRAAPEDGGRALLAGALLLFLPAHAHMSAMVNEELLAAFFTSLTLLLVARPGLSRPGDRTATRQAAWVGLAAGLALLSKLSGVLALVTAAASYAWAGARRGAARPAGMRIAVLVGVALLVGGWFFVRNQLLFGSLQPFGLPAHRVMFEMPPGQRELLDYVRFPLSTFRDPQLLNPELLRSVWGSTYASVWFDAHRSFLPDASRAVSRLGGLTLALGLLPTAAFLVGLVRGARRAPRDGGALDVPLLVLTALTLAGYAVYSWQNPWFAVLKGTALLGLSLPYAFYASEVLVDWMRRGRLAALGIGTALVALAACVTISCTFNWIFERKEVSGVPWESKVGP